jgi:hypothetical protein
MKTKILLTTLLLITGCVSVHSTSDDHGTPSERLGALHSDAPRKRVLILPFINESIEKDPAIPRAAREALIAGLKQTDNFVIIDNQDIPKDLTNYQRDGQYNFDEIAKIGSQLGISALIEGKIRKLTGKQSGDSVGLFREANSSVEATVSIRAYAPSQRREILNETRSATSHFETHKMAGDDEPQRHMSPSLVKEAVYAAYQGMILPLVKAMDKLNWNGRIALVNGEKIFLNAGKLTGINVGDILRVSDQGEEIYDPSTGGLIGQAPGRVKGTLEVVSFFGKDGCIAIIHSGSGFKDNDQVELY